MTYEGDIGVVSGRYHSVDGHNGSPEPATVLELFGRTEDGASVCLLVSGLQPSFEITPLSAWRADMEISDFILDRIKNVESMNDVVEVTGPVMKLTDLGQRPVWAVTARQPYLVPNLRKSIAKQSWQIYSGDIPFLNRFFLDYDLGMHIAVQGSVVDRRNEPDENLERTHAVIQAGGSGRYAVDVTIACDVTQIKDCPPFPVPFRVFSFDLETSIEHETILCAAAWVEDMGTGTRQEYSFRGDEASIMENLTLVVRSMDPDIITGYNIDNFDLPRMDERAKVLARKNKMTIVWMGAELNRANLKSKRNGQDFFHDANPLVLGILQVEVLSMLGGKLEWL